MTIGGSNSHWILPRRRLYANFGSEGTYTVEQPLITQTDTLVKIRDEFNEEAWALFVRYNSADKGVTVRHYGKEYVTPMLDVLGFDRA